MANITWDDVLDALQKSLPSGIDIKIPNGFDPSSVREMTPDEVEALKKKIKEDTERAQRDNDKWNNQYHHGKQDITEN